MTDKLLTTPLPKNANIAFICSPQMGDTLISMVTINNLVRNGYMIDVFGDFAYALRAWFPWANIFPALKLEEQQRLAAYPTVLHMYDSDLAKHVGHWHSNSIILSNSPLYKARIPMVDIQVTICQQEFGLTNIVRDNNIQPLAGLNPHHNKQRIVMHPTSSLKRKCWPKNKFIKLAQQLKQQGYSICFIVAPAERPAWLDVVHYGIELPEFSSLSDIAAFIYESAFFIGNDSGIGHLASNLGVPTVSIILRKGVARQWRPSWALGEVVLSPAWLNPRPLKEKLWKYFISVKMVLDKFYLLRQRYEQNGNIRS